MPLIETKGAASAQGFGEFAASSAGAVTYIEDVFSTYLWAGNAASRTIVNGINLATKGGLVWIKSRGQNTSHVLVDSARGAPFLESNSTQPQNGNITMVDSLNANGFGVTSSAIVNGSGYNYASWTFRKQPKFFDVVTFNGNGSTQTISHNLGSAPGCIMVKCITEATDWWVYHRSLGTNQVIKLNTTAAQDTSSTAWNNTAPTSTVFSIGNNGQVNSNGQTYVAYLFAHNAGGFGLTGTDNVISCGSYTGNGSTSGPTVTLGYEPQWLLVKNASSAVGWYIVDNMRGFPNGASLFPNDSIAESNALSASIQINATGFTLTQNYAAINASGSTYIYIAIRRGPMKVPTSGTSVFNPVLAASTAPAFKSSNFNSGIDSAIGFYTPGYDDGTNAYANWQSRLTGTGQLQTPNTRVEISQSYNKWDYMDGQNSYVGLDTLWGAWLFRRAPGFFDEVCYTGSGTGQTIYHNLGVVPELMIFKTRTGALRNWGVYVASVGTGKKLWLNSTNAVQNDASFVPSTPTSTILNQGNADETDEGGNTYVAYLFATCAGVSKVGSYTGTGATQTINCGFAAGARFVLIKRTDVSGVGGWYVWDTARGMVAGTDPFISLNNTAAEVNTNTVYTTSVGFQIVATSAGINASGGNYIYLAIA